MHYNINQMDHNKFTREHIDILGHIDIEMVHPSACFMRKGRLGFLATEKGTANRVSQLSSGEGWNSPGEVRMDLDPTKAGCLEVSDEF